MAWYSNPLFPWNWPSDVSKTLMSQIENAMEYLFAQFLDTILSIISDIFGFLMTIFQGIMQWLVNIAISMGVFALPVFAIMTTSMIGIAYLAFALVKDTPVVGALA